MPVVYVLFFLENIGRHYEWQCRPKRARVFFMTFRTFKRVFSIYQNICGFSSYHIYRSYRLLRVRVCWNIFPSTFCLLRFRFQRISTIFFFFVEYRRGKIFESMRLLPSNIFLICRHANIVILILTLLLTNLIVFRRVRNIYSIDNY